MQSAEINEALLLQYQKILDSDLKTYPPAQFMVDNLKDRIQYEINLISNPLRIINFFQECLRNRNINEQELLSLLINEDNKVAIIRIFKIINMNPIQVLKSFDEVILEQIHQQALHQEEGKVLIGTYIPLLIQENSIEEQIQNDLRKQIEEMNEEKEVKYHSIQNLQSKQVSVMTEDLKSQFRMMMKNRKGLNIPQK